MSKSNWWSVTFIIFLMVVAFFPRSVKYEDAKSLKNLYPYLEDISMSNVIGCWRGSRGSMYVERCDLSAGVDQSLMLNRLLNEGWTKTSHRDFAGELSFSWCRGSARINFGKYAEVWLLEYKESGRQKC